MATELTEVTVSSAARVVFLQYCTGPRVFVLEDQCQLHRTQTEVFSSAFGQSVSIFSFFGSLNSSCSNI